MGPERLLDPRSGRVHSIHVSAWIFSSGTRPREGGRLLAMRLATPAQSIISILSALEIFHHRRSVAGIEISRRPALR